ncbi:MAG: hypothetical protein ACKVHU_22090, partial [Acidimicrobiales bacterium]
MSRRDVVIQVDHWQDAGGERMSVEVGNAEYHEAIIIGAGLSGIYQLYRLVELGLDVACLE